MIRLGVALCLLALRPGWAAAAEGRQPSTLTLEVAAVSLSGEWKVRVADVAEALQLDSNHDGTVSWPEIEHRRGDIESYLGAHLRIGTQAGDLAYRFQQLAYGTQGGEAFLLARLSADAADTIQSLEVASSLPRGKVDLTVVWAGNGMESAPLLANRGPQKFARSDAARSGFVTSFQQGVWHIWTGYDHILFLIVLLIPSVFQRTAAGREAVQTFNSALIRVVIIVSAFTVAHSATLACAASGWISLPSRLVESVIAASIVIAAINNLMPRAAGGRSAALAFGFGLIHGFGFAGALSEIGAEGAPLWRTLLAFNLGVEAGQLAIVAVFLPVAYLLRQTRFYRTGVLYGGSSIAGLCALLWFWQRAFGGSV
jgi:HupE / UreJ protein